MGFHPRQPASPKPKMQLVASVAPGNIGKLADFAAVADGVILSLPSQADWNKVAPKPPKTLWGARLEVSGVNLANLIEKGCDFVIFSLQAPLEAVESSQIGKILAVDASLGDGWLRAINDLPVDAVFLQAESKEGLSWERLLLFQRCSNLVAKPLVASVGADVIGGDLQALWTAGIDCVVIEAATPEKVKNIRQIIDSLAFPSPRRREKAGALLPRIAHEAHHAVEEEEEDD